LRRGWIWSKFASAFHTSAKVNPNGLPVKPPLTRGAFFFCDYPLTGLQYIHTLIVAMVKARVTSFAMKKDLGRLFLANFENMTDGEG
jgi:hypothetical protein